jgi:putative membrane protein insertion efficiency factor
MRLPAAETARPTRRLVGRLAGLGFRLYKSLLSPLLQALSPSRCLYLPTCSEYAYTAVVRYGAVRGSWLAVRRMMRCHPWGKGGLDPVPERTAPPEHDRILPAAPRQTSPNHLP